MRGRLGRAQTLVELVVAMGQIAVLSAVVYPCFAAARRRAQQSNCIANLRQIGQALLMYTEDFGDYPLWMYQIHPSYVTNDDLFACASDPFWSRGGWMQDGLFGLYAKEPAMQFSRPKFRFTYCDFGFLRDPVDRAALLASDSGSYTACVVHGERPTSTAWCFHGRTLRLRFDGGVTSVHVTQPPRRMTFWRVLCDDPDPRSKPVGAPAR